MTDEITAIVHEAPEDQLALEDANSEVNNGGGGSAADID